jgi:hypothetical protein
MQQYDTWLTSRFRLLFSCFRIFPFHLFTFKYCCLSASDLTYCRLLLSAFYIIATKSDGIEFSNFVAKKASIRQCANQPLLKSNILLCVK